MPNTFELSTQDKTMVECSKINKKLIEEFEKLNTVGQQKIIDYFYLITNIEDYQARNKNIVMFTKPTKNERNTKSELRNKRNKYNKTLGRINNYVKITK